MKKTSFFDSHKQLRARFILYAGWQMPFTYKNPTTEHLQTRQNGSLFDVSHMGQIRIRGKQSLNFLERLLPSDLKSLKTGKALYSVLCLPTGGLLDDLIVYALSEGEDYLLCVNAAAGLKDMEWLREQKKEYNLSLEDESSAWDLIAIQGPRAIKLCERIFPSFSLSQIPKFHFIEKQGMIFSRTGYTGEEGFEIYVLKEKSLPLWNKFLSEGSNFDIFPAGLGARDTLRLEMAYLLSGQDFDESKSPLQAGLNRLLRSKKDYIGKTAIQKQAHEGGYSKLKAFIVEEPSGVPRKDHSIYSKNGGLAGTVCSGAKSPSLEKMIGLAYINEKAMRTAKENLFLEIRGAKAKIKLIRPPFIKK